MVCAEVITSGAGQIPSGWGAFIFAISLVIVSWGLSVYWKLKLERLQKEIESLRRKK